MDDTAHPFLQSMPSEMAVDRGQPLD